MKNEFKLNRRTFLQSAGAAGAVALMGAPTILHAAPMKLTFGHGAAPGNPRSIAADKFAELVKQKSGGAIEVTVAGAETLGSDAAMLTSLRTGTLAISANSQGPVSAIVPELAALGNRSTMAQPHRPPPLETLRDAIAEALWGAVSAPALPAASGPNTSAAAVMAMEVAPSRMAATETSDTAITAWARAETMASRAPLRALSRLAST